MKVAIWQVVSRHIQRRLNHRIRAGTPAQGASITSTTIRPWPCAIQPATRAARQLVARLNIEHQGPWGASHAHQMEALQPDEQITSITTIKRRRAAAGRVRHCRGPLKIAGVEVRSSSRTSTSTRNPRSTPGHPHSTRKSPNSPLIGRPTTFCRPELKCCAKRASERASTLHRPLGESTESQFASRIEMTQKDIA